MPQPIILIFLFMLGACVGSFLNVVVWRLPRGQSLNHPRSHCPKCNRTLKWYDNIPILGWVKLYGRCRFCGRKISPRYPLVEALTAFVFVFYYFAIYLAPTTWHLGPSAMSLSRTGFLQQRFSHDFAFTWPIFLLYLWLLCVLLAASLIDAELFIIPLGLIWGVPGGLVIVSVLIHVLADRPGLPGAIMTDLTGGAIGIGGGLGLLLSLLLLKLGKLPVSFADGGPLLEIEKLALEKQASVEAKAPEASAERAIEAGSANGLPDGAAAEAAGPVGGASPMARVGPAAPGMISPAVGETLPSGASVAEAFIVSGPAANDVMSDAPPEYTPGRVRAEIRKEMLFLVAPLAGALLALYLTRETGPLHQALDSLLHVRWVASLLGCLYGLVVGGFIVWFTRIAGSLVFGREAMGMGDVDMMAGVGAAIGAGPVALSFFLAPFFGIVVAVWMLLSGTRRELPYGPYLSLAVGFVLLWYSQVAAYLMPGIEGLMGLVR